MMWTFFRRTATVAVIGLFAVSSAKATEWWDKDLACREMGSCDDGMFCNGLETCDEFDECVNGAPPCDAGFRCTEEDDSPYYSCIEVTGLCYDADGNWEAMTLEDCTNAHPEREWSQWQDEPPCPRYSSGFNARAGVRWILHGVMADPDGTYFRIGDDYAIAGESFVCLERFRFFGGVDRPGGRLIFRFWDGRVDPPVEVDGFSVTLPVGGLFVWTLGTATEPLGITIPPFGYVTMEPGDPTVEGHWVSADDVDMLGDNDDELLWIDDELAPHLSARDDGPDILAFELMGKACPEPLAICCIEAPGVIECEMMPPWLCPGAGPLWSRQMTEVPSGCITYMENDKENPDPEENKCRTVEVGCGGGGVAYASYGACRTAVEQRLVSEACVNSGADCIPCEQGFDENGGIIYTTGTAVACELKDANNGCDGDWTCQPLHPAPSYGCSCECQGPPI